MQESASLPQIYNRSSSPNGLDSTNPPKVMLKKIIDFIPPEAANTKNRDFDQHFAMFDNAQIPPCLDVNDNMKLRVQTLEQITQVQSSYNKISTSLICDLDTDLYNADNNLQNLINVLRTKFDSDLDKLKKEYEHKFELQAVENKRILEKFSSLKAESNQTKRKLHSTVARLRAVQDEMGIELPQLDEDDNNSFSDMDITGRPSSSKQSNQER
jgi:hypothetical protein